MRDAAVNFDMYRILQRHRVVSLPLHDFLFLYTSVAIEVLKLHTVRWFFTVVYRDFRLCGRDAKPKITAHDHAFPGL